MLKSLLIFLLFACIICISTTPMPLIDRRCKIMVSAQGEISNPGIFELVSGATINDLLKYLKLNESADITTLNGLIELNHEDVLVIPSKTEKKLISINTADMDQLIELPGIGQSTAKKIIEYRNNNGLFQNIEELKNIKGIGEAKFNKLKELISL